MNKDLLNIFLVSFHALGTNVFICNQKYGIIMHNNQPNSQKDGLTKLVYV